MRANLRPRVRRAAVAVSCVLCCSHVGAEPRNSEVAAAGRTSSGLEEIVVTAQRREERAQDVPLAITAFDAEALSRIGFTNLSDLMEQVPSLAITPYPNASSSLVVFMCSSRVTRTGILADIVNDTRLETASDRRQLFDELLRIGGPYSLLTSGDRTELESLLLEQAR